MHKITGSSGRDDVFLFDSLAVSKRLQEEGGYTRKQAETWVTVLVEIMASNLATKKDVESIRKDIESIRKETESIRKETESIRKETEKLRDENNINIERLRKETTENIERLRKETTENIERLRKETTENIERSRQEFSSELKLLESRITIRLGTLIVSGVTVLAVLMKIL